MRFASTVGATIPASVTLANAAFTRSLSIAVIGAHGAAVTCRSSPARLAVAIAGGTIKGSIAIHTTADLRFAYTIISFQS